MSDEKIEVYCPECDAVYKILHDLGDPYRVGFCAFCGEEIEQDEYLDREDWEDED